MKNLAITTIVALGIAAPALAQTQLERSIGAEAGQYTLGEQVLLKSAATQDGNERNVYLGNRKIQFSGNNIHNSVASDIFDRLAEESRDSN